MARWLVFFIVLVPIITIGALVMTAKGFAPTARLSATAAADPACRAEVLAGLELLRRDLGLLADFAPPDADAIAATGALDKTYARDGVRHTVSFGLDADEAGACSLRMWAMKEEQPGRTHSSAGAFGSAGLPGCRCE